MNDDIEKRKRRCGHPLSEVLSFGQDGLKMVEWCTRCGALRHYFPFHRADAGTWLKPEKP